MITTITISNYALIDRIEIVLEKGLTVITGETGAGKSILLGAIGLALGQRAEAVAIADKSRKCVVEIVYDVSGYDLHSWFEANDLDYESQVVVRREIHADGKSRGFINDTPVNNKLLKELGNELIDVHSQHQSLLIGQPGYQLEVLDAFCNHFPRRDAYRELYQKRRQLLQRLAETEERARAEEQEEDYLRFQFNQLDAAHLRAGEQQELEEELTLLTHAENIQATFSSLSHTLTGADTPVVQQLRGIKNRISLLEGVVKEAKDYTERIQSILLELEDIADEAERKAGSVESSPIRIQAVNDRLHVIYDLLHKHRREGVEELMALRESLARQLEGIASYASSIEQVKQEIAAVEQEMQALADQLHQTRSTEKERMEERMTSLLVNLGIKHARFLVSIQPAGDFTPSGTDEVLFLFSANKNQEPGELSKIASGGEISRLMLSLKYILSHAKQLPVIIFDEIDTGVSGETAHRMAVMMKKMSQRMQVISITHLPQIAAAGTAHFEVYKEDDQQSTISRIKHLAEEERVVAIARMISGSAISDIALQNARLLLHAIE